MNSYWIDRLRNGFIYVTASVLIIGVIGYLVLRRTSVNKTTVNSGGVVNNYDPWKEAKIDVFPLGCAHIKYNKMDEKK